MLGEAYRVLKRGGVLCLSGLTYGQVLLSALAFLLLLLLLFHLFLLFPPILLVLPFLRGTERSGKRRTGGRGR